MKKHEVSIIMPCYNVGAYVEKAVKSVLSQNVPAQIIAVDDGSTDNTLNILETFRGKIQIVRSTNNGVANARNKAVNFVDSDYTVLLDADDALAPGGLDYILQKARKNGQEVLHGNFSSWDKTMQTKLHLHKTPRLGKFPLSLLVRRNISPPGCNGVSQ